MGWWTIKPETIEAAGVPSEPVPHYLGDAPWDIIDDAICLVGQVFADRQWPDESEAHELFAGRIVPPRRIELGPEVAEQLARIVAEMWADLDECYRDDWERSPLPAEKWCLLGYAVSHFLTPTTLDTERLAELDGLPREEARAYLQMVREEIASGHWYRIEDAGRTTDLTSVAAFDRWMLGRFPDAANPEVP